MNTVAVIQFPGSNCERETHAALKRAGFTTEDFLWNHAVADLEKFDAFVIVGGFSYEDRGRSGLIASLDPLIAALAKQAECGKVILGICNGAQILIESGLVPGTPNKSKRIALMHNQRIQNGHVLGVGFYNDWVYVKPSHTHANNAFTRRFSGPIKIPAAHAEGRFLLDEGLYSELVHNNCALFHYCDHQGHVTPEFPINPNGSDQNLAAVCNAAGNVMAMMPHPERCVAGDVIFQSMFDYIQEKTAVNSIAIKDASMVPELKDYHREKSAVEWLIKLDIHDNTAISIENVLQQQGSNVRVKRYQHWQIQAEDKLSPQQLKKIEQSYELFNPQKESMQTTIQVSESMAQYCVLVRNKNDNFALQKLAHLQRIGFDFITELRHGCLWQLQADAAELKKVLQFINDRQVLFNPISEDCFYYEA